LTSTNPSTCEPAAIRIYKNPESIVSLSEIPVQKGY
jgi:hypothetical protein